MRQDPTDQPIVNAVNPLRYWLAVNAPPVDSPRETASYASDPRSLQRVTESLTRGDWAQARWLATQLSIDSAGRTDGIGAFLSNDPVLADHAMRLGDMLMDEIADGAVTSDLPELFLSAMFMARTGAAAVIAHTLLAERLDDRKNIVQLAAMNVSDPELRVHATECLIAAIDDPDDFNSLDLLLELPDADHAMGEALLALRPSNPSTTAVQRELLMAYLNRAVWYPDEHKVLDAFRHIVETARTAGEFANFPRQDPHDLLRVYLDGTAVECIERNMGRAAAIVSLCRLFHEQDDEAIRRAIFESVRVSDWPLAHRVLEVAQWPAGPIEADGADFFHHSITPALLRLASQPERRHLTQLLELGDACLRAVNGTPGENTRRYAEDREKIANGRYEGIDSNVYDAVAMDYMADSIWGVDDPKTLTSGFLQSSEVRHPQVLKHHGRYVLSAQSVKQYAVESSLVRRRGPGALLILVDVIIESGDLTHARAWLDSVGEVYPYNSMVLEWKHKLATHTWNDARAAAAIKDLLDLWRDDVDDATPVTQVGVLKRMVNEPAAADFIKERARRLALVPAFRTWADELQRIADG